MKSEQNDVNKRRKVKIFCLKRKKSAGIQGTDFERPDNVRAKSHQAENVQSKNKNIEDILEGFEEKARIQRDELEKVANLRDRIEKAKKYSYDWFLSLMELEVQSQGSTEPLGRRHYIYLLIQYPLIPRTIE